MQDIEGFNEFWSAYPRKVGKLAAQKAYKRALKLTTASTILRSAKIYASEGREVQFIAHPATWLNAGRWTDYPDPGEKVGETRGNPGKVYYAAFSSAELEAWEDYGRSIRKTYPRDRAGGWYFPTQWPPDYKPYQPRDDFAKSISAAYDAIKERKAAGGPGWEPKR